MMNERIVQKIKTLFGSATVGHYPLTSHQVRIEAEDRLLDVESRLRYLEARARVETGQLAHRDEDNT